MSSTSDDHAGEDATRGAEATPRPKPNDALYEVQVWNVDTSTAEWSCLTVGHGLAAVVDQAEDFLIAVPDDDLLRVVVTNRA